MGILQDFGHAIHEGIHGIGQAVHGLTTNIDDILHGVVDSLQNLTGELIHNLEIGAVQIFNAMLETVYNLPKTLVRALSTLFRDPGFWRAVLLFIGLVTFASGLDAAASAPWGLKSKAFMEGAGMIYQGWHVDFVVKAHRVLNLVSPEYREQFAAVLAPLSNKMNSAGIDLGYATALFSSVMSLSQSFGAMIGQDWNITSQDWVKKLEAFGNSTSETLKKFAANPELMIDWFDENAVRPGYNAAANFMNRLSSGLSNLVKTTDLFVNRVIDVRRGLGRVAYDIDNLYGTNYAELLDAELIGFDTIIYEQWKIINDQFGDLAKIFHMNTQEIKENMTLNVMYSETLSNSYPGRLKREIAELSKLKLKPAYK